MGNRYEVWIWQEDPNLGWRYDQHWAGESLIACLWRGWKMTRSYGAVRLVLR